MERNSSTAATAAPQKPARPFFSLRKIVTKEAEKEFKIVVVDSAEQWPLAKDFVSVYNMRSNKSAAGMKFKMRGASLEEWEAIEIAHQIAELTDEERENQSPDDIARSAKLKEEISDKRNVATFELVIGSSIPGDTTEEKVAWLRNRNPAEVDALFSFVLEKACGFSDGDILNEYSHMCIEAKLDTAESVDFKDFDDWKAATDSRYTFRVAHFGEDRIFEFPLKAISTDRKRQIEDETKEPDPPRAPGRNPKTRKYDPAIKAYNYQDPTYRKNVRGVNQKKTAMYLEATLMFELPGNNYQEKYKWAAQRLFGDVIRLKKFIENEVIGYGARYDFF